MLTEILVEALTNMDYDTLEHVLESCSEEELAFVDEAMESLSDKDKEDFSFINKIQKDATSKGWGKVSKEDRDKFVNVMTKTKNLSLLKKAMKIGKREASHDDKVANAIGAIGSVAVGARFGGLAAKKALKGQPSDIEAYYSNAKQSSAFKASTQGDVNEKIASLKDFIASSNGKVDPAEIDRAKSSISKLSRLSKKLSEVQLDLPDAAGAKLAELQGSAIGAGIGAGVSAGASALRQYRKYNKDRKDVMSQGDVDHPNNRWKKNRKDAELRSMAEKRYNVKLSDTNS